MPNTSLASSLPSSGLSQLSEVLPMDVHLHVLRTASASSPPYPPPHPSRSSLYLDHLPRGAFINSLKKKTMCFLHILIIALRKITQLSAYFQRSCLSQLIVQWHLWSSYCMPGSVLVAK